MREESLKSAYVKLATVITGKNIRLAGVDILHPFHPDPHTGQPAKHLPPIARKDLGFDL